MQELIEIVLDIITLFRQITDEREKNLSLNVPLHYIKGSKHDSNEKYYELEFDDDELIEMKQIENGADAASTTTSSINVKSTKHTDLLYNMFYFKSIYNKVYNKNIKGLRKYIENIANYFDVTPTSSLKMIPSIIVNQIAAKRFSLRKCIAFQRFLDSYNEILDEPMKKRIDEVYHLFIEFIENVEYKSFVSLNKKFVKIEASKSKFKKLYERMLDPVETNDTLLNDLNVIGYFIHREHRMEKIELEKECNGVHCCGKSCKNCKLHRRPIISILKNTTPTMINSPKSGNIDEIVRLKDLYKQYDKFSTKVLINAFNTSVYGINKVNNIIEEINKTLKILEDHIEQVEVKIGGKDRKLKSRKKRSKSRNSNARTKSNRKRA